MFFMVNLTASCGFIKYRGADRVKENRDKGENVMKRVTQMHIHVLFGAI